MEINIFFVIVIIFSAVLHEYMHGWMADRLGDPTAKLAGRLTLNPLPHIDPIGSVLLPLAMIFLFNGQFLFAYAKPVPVNPYNLRGKYANAIVAFAGPAANIITAIFFGLLVRLLPHSNFELLLSIIVHANILLAVFNLVPIPPLDGSKILFSILPYRFQGVKVFLETYGLFFLFFFIYFLFWLLIPIIQGLFYLLTGLPT